MFINIEGMNKAAIVAALYNNSKPLGMGAFHFNPAPMTEDQAQKLIDSNGGKIDLDYVGGRVMKVFEMEDGLRVDLYDRDIGKGEAERIINGLRAN
jgi:hypothetical protein